MAISDSVQLLSTILSDKRAKHEAAAQRGHETTMQSMSLAQRNLENQLNMNFQRQQNVESQIMNLRNNLSSAGVDVNEFGSDSGLSDMVGRIEGSLVEQKDQLDNITSAQMDELGTLQGAQAAFTQGATFASSTDVSFDDEFNVDPTSEFGALRGALRDPDELAIVMAERGVELPENPRARAAFVQGASNILASEDTMLARETARNQAITARSQANRARLDEVNYDLSLLDSKKSLADRFQTDVTDLITGDVATLANPDADENEVERIQNQMFSRLTEGAQGFTTNLANMIGVDLDSLEEGSEDSDYFQQIAQSFSERGKQHIQNIATNPSAFSKSIERSLNDVNRAIEKHGTFENAIREKAISPSTVGNILGFVGNPYISGTFAGGFEKLNEINKNMKVREELLGNKDTSQAVAKAHDAMNDDDFLELGDALRSAVSNRVLPQGQSNNQETLDEESALDREFVPEEGSSYDPDRSQLAEGVSSVFSGVNEFFNRQNLQLEKRDEVRSLWARLNNISRQIESGRLNPDDKEQAEQDYEAIFKTLKTKGADILKDMGRYDQLKEMER